MRIHDLSEQVLSPAEAFMSAVYAQAARGADLPYALSYFPVASLNPFQRLLYCRASESGFAVVPTLKMSQLGVVGWRGRSVIHLHWLASLLYGIATRAAARTRIEGFRKELAAWRAAGHHVVWSMHNVLPHDCSFPEVEVELRRVLVEGCHAIHVLSRASLEEARSHYDLPAHKVFHVPHPSYEGWYANVGDRAAARLDLDLPGREFTFLFFGSLQPYKGVLELLDAFSRLRSLHPAASLRLLIAGKPVDPDYVTAIHRRVWEVPYIRFIPSAMEERDVQTLFNASDVVVVPYRRTLNSGVALLAASFYKPVIAPRAGGVLETFSADPALLYTNASDDGLAEAMDRALTHRPPSEFFDNILAAHRPDRISAAFFAALRMRLFDSQAAA